LPATPPQGDCRPATELRIKMSNARKLQTEIDRVMKKVDEGVILFDEIWEKVYAAEQQNQKEKYEVDLKKEIKKLQRLRDQIKTWIGSSDVKDKDALIDARKLIETKMEQFKICEKETKTKTYSKEGLLRQEKLDPAEQAKKDCTAWIAEYIDKLNELVEDRDVEIEKLSSGKGKKTNKHLIEEHTEVMNNHKFHVSKLEGIMRLVNNDRLAVETVEEVKEDLDYYLEAHEDEDYMQSYDEEIFYEPLGLDTLDVVNVDRVTQAPATGKGKGNKDDDTSASSGSKKKDKALKKTAASSSFIPLTIGRARVSSAGEKEKKTPTKAERSQSTGSVLGPTPSARAPPAPPASGPSMAALLKKDSEQQEKERQQKAALQQAQQQRLLQEQQARQQAEQLRQQQLLKQQQEAQQRQQQEALRQQQAAQQKAAQQEALKRQQAQQEAAAKQQQLQQQQEAAKQQQLQQQQQAQLQAQLQQQQQQQQAQAAQQQQASGGQGAIEGLLTSGLGGLSLGSTESGSGGSSPIDSSAAISPNQQQRNAAPTSNFDATSSYLGALNDSFLHCPSNADSERQRTYTPRNPYPTPSSYPSTPSQIFDNPAVFEKLGTDCLFFIFYYAQGTYQQYLAARELKKQSWRYHKKYMTWFQRHEEPKVTTDEYEQGTYVYFDYETGWCQRIKSDFRFEYSFLEDSLH